MEMEEWQDIKGYEGLYQVSNYGRVKSLNYNHTSKEEIMKPKKISRGRGYLQMCLYKNGKRKYHQLHRLVLTTFNPVENMEQLEVNHIDENKENNKLSNLEWCTSKYNVNYGTRNKRISEAKSIPVVQLTLESELVEVYGSGKETVLYGFHQSHVKDCCKGIRKTHNGYKWCYLYEYIANIHPNIKTINLFNKTYEVNRR